MAINPPISRHPQVYDHPNPVARKPTTDHRRTSTATLLASPAHPKSGKDLELKFLDKNIEKLNVYNQISYTHDVFFAMSHGVNRGTIKLGKKDEREEALEYDENAVGVYKRCEEVGLLG